MSLDGTWLGELGRMGTLVGRGKHRRTMNVLVCKEKRERSNVFQSLPVCRILRWLRAVVHL